MYPRKQNSDMAFTDLLFGEPRSAYRRSNRPTRTSVVDIHKVNGVRPYFDEYIGRAVRGTEFTADSVWANPFRSDDPNCLKKYEAYIRERILKDPTRYDLRTLVGKRLGCWCITTDSFEGRIVCHGQVLMKIIAEVFF